MWVYSLYNIESAIAASSIFWYENYYWYRPKTGVPKSKSRISIFIGIKRTIEQERAKARAVILCIYTVYSRAFYTNYFMQTQMKNKNENRIQWLHYVYGTHTQTYQTKCYTIFSRGWIFLSFSYFISIVQLLTITRKIDIL